MGWTAYLSVLCEWSSCFDHDCTGNIAIVRKLRAVLYHAPMILGYFMLMNHDWTVPCHIPCLWAFFALVRAKRIVS